MNVALDGLQTRDALAVDTGFQRFELFQAEIPEFATTGMDFGPTEERVLAIELRCDPRAITIGVK